LEDFAALAASAVRRRARTRVDCGGDGDRRRRCHQDPRPSRSCRVGGLAGWRLGRRALLGRQTRPHQDLDLVIARDDLAAAQQTLAPAGSAHDPTAVPGLPSRLVLVDGDGRQVDLHPVIFDRHGSGWQDLGADARGAYPAEELTATGVIAGRTVRCKTPALEVRHRLGYRFARRTDTILPCSPSGSVSPYLQASPTWVPAASLALDRVRPGGVDRWLVGARRPGTPTGIVGLLRCLPLRQDGAERHARVPPRRTGLAFARRVKGGVWAG